MKNLLIKDQKFRYCYFQNEITFYLFFVIKKIKFLKTSFKKVLLYKFKKIGFTKTKISNRCIYTNRKHSIKKLFKISRIVFLKLIKLNLINGFF